MPGMRKSQTSRSGVSSTAFSSASAESLAVVIAASGDSACCSMPRIIGLSSTRSSLTLSGMIRLFSAPVLSGLAAALAFEHDLANLDTLVRAFEHVVQRQRANADRHQGLHLDPSFC